MVPPAAYAQSPDVQRSVKWTAPSVVSINDSIIKQISFEGAYYTGLQALPFWNETFYGDGLAPAVQINNCSFVAITDEELMLVQAYIDNIPFEIQFSSSGVTSRKQKGVYIEILPFIREKSTNQVLKLISFSIQFAENDQAAAQQGRSYAPNSVLAKGNWYKLAVVQSGIHRIEYNDLVAMGINPATINPSQIGIFGRGGVMLPESNSEARTDDLPENAIEVTGQADGTFDKSDVILFYAQGPVSWQYSASKQLWEHTTHLYTDTISYFLTTDQGTGKRVGVKVNPSETETHQVNAFDYYTYYDENNFNLIKSGRQWFAQIFDVILSRSFSFDIPTLAAGGEVKVRTLTAAKSINASSFEFSIGSQSWTATHSPISVYPNSSVASGALSFKTLQSVTLPLKIDVRYNKTSSTAAGYLDLLDVTARCDLRFTGGQLDFRDSQSFGAGNIAKYTIRDAASKIRLWDVTHALNPFKVESAVSGNDLVFKSTADTLRQYVGFDESKFLKPRFVQKIQNQNLHASAGTELLIITPQLFMPQAIRLATFHANTSDMDVMVLDLATIYNEFSSGTTDITAIRDFIKMLYDKSPAVKMPKYLLLFGDASYDFKDKIVSNTNFVPSWQSPESYNPISSLVSDDYYGMLDDNEGTSYSDVIDLGIGRFPVKTLLEAEQAVDKIVHYSVLSPENSGDWRNIISFVADDEDLNDHVDQAEQMAVSIENNYPDINLDKIYLDSFVQLSVSGGNRYPEANKAITQRVEKGSLILNYTGHGGETGWAHEEVLTVNEINNWSNFNNLPVFVTATCEFSRFDDPGRQAAGEMVLTNPKGGGIALFTTTRPTYGTPNFELNKKFYQYALSKPDGQRLRMGDIIMNSKRDKGSNENGRKYVLLGDPAMQIAFPSLQVVTTSVNNKAAGSAADTLKAYMEVRIEGMIADNEGNLVSDFNGTVYPSVYDKSVVQKTLANDGGSVFSFRLRKNLIYKGKVNVTDGRFSFSFIVPKDIAYRYDAGKISYYAADATRDACGSYTNIVVGGSAEKDITDTQGPEIKLYMNDLRFRNGGITDANPRLLAIVSDENGINTIGNGIGHDITAVLDGNTAEPYILNEFYESDIDTFRSGYIWFPFSLLAAGEHTLTVKVWDIFNNSSEAEISFVVHSSGEFVITNAYNFPNPFMDFTDIVFEHNQQNVDFSTTAEIYSITGQLVCVIEQTATQAGSVSTPLRWNGLDLNGNAVPAGMYIYNLRVRTSNGLYSQSTGKLLYQK